MIANSAICPVLNVTVFYRALVTSRRSFWVKLGIWPCISSERCFIISQTSLNNEQALTLRVNWFFYCRMNLTKIEPESDSETPEPYSQFQFTNVHQKLMSVPVSFTEMKAEIKVRGH